MKKRILLIEDNNEVRENTAEILELAGYSVETAANGKEGVVLAQKAKPDLIICDIMMPILDGYGVLHMLSKNSETSGIPFIFLTAKAERGDLRKGMEMGADDYLTKPFEDTELLNAIEGRLRKNELLRKEYSKNIEGLNSFINEARGIEALQKLSQSREVREFKKKQTIYVEGNYPRGIFFLNKGKVKTIKANEQGKELITGLYKEGDFFGYLALLEDQEYTDTALTLETSEICLIPKDDFFDLLYKNSDVSQKFLKLLSAGLQENEEQLIKLAYNSVRKRVAEALVKLNSRYNEQKKLPFSMKISREDLANIAGTAPETAIRVLSDFKEERLIEIQGGTVTIVNLDRLAGMKD